MKLLPDWRAVLTKAWSVRFLIFAGILSGAEVVLQLLQPVLESSWPTGLFAALSGLATAAALVARVMAQANLPSSAPPK